VGKAPTTKEASNEEETSPNCVLHADGKLHHSTTGKDALAYANHLWSAEGCDCSSHRSFLREGRREDEAPIPVRLLVGRVRTAKQKGRGAPEISPVHASPLLHIFLPKSRKEIMHIQVKPDDLESNRKEVKHVEILR
jgi:hypothetical protein